MASSKDAEPVPFQTGADRGYVFRPDEAPALLINPAASDQALLAAAQARAGSLHKSLTEWCLTADSAEAVSVATVTSCLQPIAEEVTLLLNALAMRLIRAQRGKGDAAQPICPRK